MSSCRKNFNKIKYKEIDINGIIIFIKIIGTMAGAILLMGIGSFLIFPKNVVSNVVYTIVIAINFIVLMGSFIATGYLVKKKNKIKEEIK